MTSRPRVYTRIRPQNDNEHRQGGEVCLRAEKGHSDVMIFDDKNGEPMKTRFDHVFDTATTQADVFNHVRGEVISTLFSGYNASMFAYGQTGSGKTFTMEGSRDRPEDWGIIPRMIQAIFEKFASNPDITSANVSCSFVQIYQEKIQDLFAGRKQLEIHMDRTGQYIAQGAVWRDVRDVNECITLYHESVKQRATHATDMNMVSSRSHTILMLKLFWDEPMLPGSRAQLNLIDLAGSEKLNQSGATGERMQEAIHINKSLSALGNVVSKLVDQVKRKDRRIHIPYKDSKLTYLLQSSLGGSNLVHFILALSSSSLWKAESQATIEFGKRALQLVIRPVRNAIDYKRLEEMEAMIDKMRNHIRSLEEELKSKPQDGAGGAGAGGDNSAAFLQLKQLYQEGEERKKRAAARRQKQTQKAALKTKTELNRIIQNLPETLEDLTSHCVLFPQSKIDFRLLGGIEKLVHFIDKSPSTFFRAHAAHTIAAVIDDEGRQILGECGGIDALGRLMQVNEERCKEAACVGLDAAVRSHTANKALLTNDMYKTMVDLVFQNKNQQVQEAAATCLATIVDNYAPAKRELTPMGIVPKLVETIHNAPAEVVHVTKAATTCLGRLSHSDPEMQRAIAKEDGINILIDDVLFSVVGDRDHQVPILASYALVNLCCSNAENMVTARKHPNFEDVRFRLMEGLARAFGTNTTREGFGRATAQETTSPFPYFGVTVADKWDRFNCGGRPIFSTFMENPQYFLYAQEDLKLTVLIQDTLYEQRMQQKQRNNTVYMGLAIFEADPELCKQGLKQLDFHGKLLEIAKFTSNCENVLHCTLKKSETPYILVPFTSQRGRTTSFALSAFADRPVELTPVPETTGWVRSVVDGQWTEFTGRGGEGIDWRRNSQITIRPKENCRAVFVLSYLSLDQQRKGKLDEGDEERQNTRPRLHGRLFTHSFAPEKRYVKAICPLPQGSTFVASNAFSSNSYITTAATLTAGQEYVYIPYTDAPFEDTWRLRMFCDHDEVDVSPVNSKEHEWNVTSFAGMWAGKPLSVALQTKGKMTVMINSPGTFVRVSIADTTGLRINGIDSFWNGDANVEHNVTTSTVAVIVEGMYKKDGKQGSAVDTPFEFFIFTENPATVLDCSFTAKNSSIAMPEPTTEPAKLAYPIECSDVNDDAVEDEDENKEDDDDDDDDDEHAGSASEAVLEATHKAEGLERAVSEQKEENARLRELVKEQEGLIANLKLMTPTAAQPGTFSPPGSAHPPSRPSGTKGFRSDSRLGSRKTPPPTGGAGPVPANVVLAPAMDKVIDDVVVRLSSAAAHEKPPTAAEWNKMRRELRDLQSKLVMAKMNSK